MRVPGWKKFGSGMEEIRIRDKHTGSATPSIIILQLYLCSDFSERREHNSEGHEGGDWHSGGETGAALRHYQQHRLQTAGKSVSIMGIAEQNKEGKSDREMKGTLQEMLGDVHLKVHTTAHMHIMN